MRCLVSLQGQNCSLLTATRYLHLLPFPSWIIMGLISEIYLIWEKIVRMSKCWWKTLRRSEPLGMDLMFTVVLSPLLSQWHCHSLFSLCRLSCTGCGECPNWKSLYWGIWSLRENRFFGGLWIAIHKSLLWVIFCIWSSWIISDLLEWFDLLCSSEGGVEWGSVWAADCTDLRKAYSRIDFMHVYFSVYLTVFPRQI